MKQVRIYYEEAYTPNGIMGFYTTGYKNKEEAITALQNYIENDSEDFLENYEDSNGEPFVFDKSNVKEERYYTHKRCGIQTIIGPECASCGFEHYFTSSGRITFIYPIK